MGRNTVARFKVDKLRHIPIAVTGINEFTVAAPGGKERTRGDGFGQIPNKRLSSALLLSASTFCTQR